MEISSGGTEFDGRWKENRKHGKGTKKLKTGMVEEQVYIQTSGLAGVKARSYGKHRLRNS